MRIVSSLPVFLSFESYETRAIYYKSYKVVRRIRPALYCALRARRVDLSQQEAEIWKAKCEGSKGSSSNLFTRNQ